MPIDLRAMRYVIAIAETGGFQRAAERLHMAQPPLSRQIRALERELGVTLFHRRPSRLTAEGRVFVDAARAILADVDRAVAATRGAGQAEVGVVRVGYGPMSGYSDIPRLVAAVRERQPGIRLEAREMWDTELGSALLENDLDIAIGRHLLIGGDVARRVLWREPYLVVVGDGHPLADRRSVALRELRGETFRFLPRRFAPRYYDAVLAALRATGEEFTVWENPAPGLRNYGDLRTGGFMLLPGSIEESLPATLRCLRVRDPLPAVELEMVWRPAAGKPTEAVLAIAQTIPYRPVVGAS
ncbi:MAG: LysR family transcriptional regulator [Pseudonocardiaceae bacterium]